MRPLYSAEVSGNVVRYHGDEWLRGRHLKDDLIIEYEDGYDLSTLPAALMAVPAVLNLAPIVWLSGETYSVPVLDPELIDSLERIRLELGSRYPQASWDGQLVADRIEPIPKVGSSSDRGLALLFSGGLDSIHSSLAIGGRQLLVAGWGNDVSYENARGWANIARDIESFAREQGHEVTWFRSNFRRVANEQHLNAAAGIQNWWGQVQHATGLVGIAAPELWRHGVRKLLISGFGAEGAMIPWGSDPEIVEAIGWDGVSVELTGGNVTRQEKTAFIAARFTSGRTQRPYIHVCWMQPDSDGWNCCRCQKCLRTAISLALEDDEYELYGFPVSPDDLSRRLRSALATRTLQVGVVDTGLWAEVQARISKLVESSDSAERSRVEPFQWIADVDFLSYRQHYLRNARLKRPFLRVLSVVAPLERYARGVVRDVRRFRGQA